MTVIKHRSLQTCWTAHTHMYVLYHAPCSDGPITLPPQGHNNLHILEPLCSVLTLGVRLTPTVKATKKKFLASSNTTDPLNVFWGHVIYDDTSLIKGQWAWPHLVIAWIVPCLQVCTYIVLSRTSSDIFSPETTRWQLLWPLLWVELRFWFEINFSKFRTWPLSQNLSKR